MFPALGSWETATCPFTAAPTGLHRLVCTTAVSGSSPASSSSASEPLRVCVGPSLLLMVEPLWEYGPLGVLVSMLLGGRGRGPCPQGADIVHPFSTGAPAVRCAPTGEVVEKRDTAKWCKAGGLWHPVTHERPGKGPWLVHFGLRSEGGAKPAVSAFSALGLQGSGQRPARPWPWVRPRKWGQCSRRKVGQEIAVGEGGQVGRGVS